MKRGLLDLAGSLPAVRSQGLRDACVAFALTCAHERARYDDWDCVALSEEALHWGARSLDSAQATGTTFALASTALATVGQPIAEIWPFDPHHEPIAQPPGCFDETFRARASELGPPTVELLRDALERDQVVCTGIPVWHEFTVASQHHSKQDPIVIPVEGTPTHAVALVGHDSAQRSVLIRNSWGSRWGIDGYAWVADAIVSLCNEFWVIDRTI